MIFLSKALHGTQRWIKFLLDRLLSGLALLLLAPLLLVVYGLVRVFMGSPVLFRQERAGQWGDRFICYKYRTMTQACSSDGQLLSDEQRLTAFGRLLRRLKIDELPQLWNIFRGDMSFVGPRPTLGDQVDAYDSYEKQRLTVKPGLTGWVQVNGGVRLSWPDRIHLDIWYIQRWSLWLDLLILVRTLGVIIWGEQPSAKALEIALKKTTERTTVSS